MDRDAKKAYWEQIHARYHQADTVAHRGNRLSGDFAWSLTLTDIKSTWTENRAIWNKGTHNLLKSIEDIEKSLPFQRLGFDCDNGSEFLNHHWTPVRQLFGYDRIDTISSIDKMNDLYKNEWSLYQHYFCPSMKLIKKAS